MNFRILFVGLALILVPKLSAISITPQECISEDGYACGTFYFNYSLADGFTSNGQSLNLSNGTHLNFWMGSYFSYYPDTPFMDMTFRFGGDGHGLVFDPNPQVIALENVFPGQPNDFTHSRRETIFYESPAQGYTGGMKIEDVYFDGYRATGWGRWYYDKLEQGESPRLPVPEAGSTVSCLLLGFLTSIWVGRIRKLAPANVRVSQ